MSHMIVDGRAVISKHSDGWCGEPCPSCKGSQYVQGRDGEDQTCGACGGTGERYEASLDYRDQEGMHG